MCLEIFSPRQFLYNSEAISLLGSFKLENKIRRAVDEQLEPDKTYRCSHIKFLIHCGRGVACNVTMGNYLSESLYNENEFESLLNNVKLGPQQRTRIMEACAISAYREQEEKTLIKILMCDDAPQFKLLTEELTLCWIHDGRHYKKLNPVVPQHTILRDDFLIQYWLYYQALKDYKEAPDPSRVIKLE